MSALIVSVWLLVAFELGMISAFIFNTIQERAKKPRWELEHDLRMALIDAESMKRSINMARYALEHMDGELAVAIAKIYLK